MPWHPAYQPPPPGSGTAAPPRVNSLDSAVTIIESHPEIQWRPLAGDTEHVPVIVFEMEVNGMFDQHDRRRGQISLLGKLSPVTDLKERDDG